MKAKISWILGGKKNTISPGQVYKPCTWLNGHSFELIVIILPDKLNAKVEASTEHGKKILESCEFKKLPIMEGTHVVGELEFYE